MEYIYLAVAKLMKAETLTGILSLASFIVVGSGYYVVTEAAGVVDAHDHKQFAHPYIRQEHNDTQKSIADVNALVVHMQANIEYNRDRADLIQLQNIEAHERQEVILLKILNKLDERN